MAMRSITGDYGAYGYLAVTYEVLSLHPILASVISSENPLQELNTLDV